MKRVRLRLDCGRCGLDVTVGDVRCSFVFTGQGLGQSVDQQVAIEARPQVQEEPVLRLVPTAAIAARRRQKLAQSRRRLYFILFFTFLLLVFLFHPRNDRRMWVRLG